MSESSYGIFLTTDHSTLIQLWLDTTCNLLYDIAFDHKTRFSFRNVFSLLNCDFSENRLYQKLKIVVI